MVRVSFHAYNIKGEKHDNHGNHKGALETREQAESHATFVVARVMLIHHLANKLVQVKKQIVK